MLVAHTVHNLENTLNILQKWCTSVIVRFYHLLIVYYQIMEDSQLHQLNHALLQKQWHTLIQLMLNIVQLYPLLRKSNYVKQLDVRDHTPFEGYRFMTDI